MKRICINQESIERLTANKISDKQLLMVKGGGSNPPNPNQTPDSPTPVPIPYPTGPTTT